MRSRVRVWWAGGASVAVSTAVVGLGVAVAGSTTSSPRPLRPVAAHAAVRSAQALAVLHRWDRRRSAAWAAGDPQALARLYVAGSRTGRRDRRDLALWTARGLRVDGLHQQVAAFRVVDRQARRMVVVVTDRTIDGVAVGARWRTAVPTSAWSSHRISLRRSGHRWRVGEVTGRAGG